MFNHIYNFCQGAVGPTFHPNDLARSFMSVSFLHLPFTDRLRRRRNLPASDIHRTYIYWCLMCSTTTTFVLFFGINPSPEPWKDLSDSLHEFHGFILKTYIYSYIETDLAPRQLWIHNGTIHIAKEPISWWLFPFSKPTLGRSPFPPQHQEETIVFQCRNEEWPVARAALTNELAPPTPW